MILPAGTDLTGADLSGADLSGRDLRGARLAHARLAGCNLHGAALDGAVLAGADLRGADLTWSGLRGANLSGADLGQAELCHADLRRAFLLAADLTNSDLSHADLQESLLACARLSGARLRGTDLAWSRLRRAVLCGADAAGARFEGADLTQADLSAVRLDAASTLRLAFLHHCALAGANLTRRHLEDGVGEEWTDLIGAAETYRQLARAFSSAGRPGDARWAERLSARSRTRSHRPDQAPRYYPPPPRGPARWAYALRHAGLWLAGGMADLVARLGMTGLPPGGRGPGPQVSVSPELPAQLRACGLGPGIAPPLFG